MDASQEAVIAQNLHAKQHKKPQNSSSSTPEVGHHANG
jgi:hypothetical protein